MLARMLEKGRRGWPVLVVLALGLLPPATVLFRDLELLISVAPDDTGYYLQIARRMMAGEGSSFDPAGPTNGYHPLWLWMLLPFACLTQDATSLFRLAMGLGLFCHAAAGLVLVDLLKRVTGSVWIAASAAAVYLVNPQVMASSVNGMETGVTTLVFLLALRMTLLAPEQRSVLRGVLLGLMFLARSDSIFMIAVLWARGTRRAVCGAAAALTVLPWILWNLHTFGSFLQVSAEAVPLVMRHQYLAQGHGELRMWLKGVLHFVGFLKSSELAAGLVVLSLLIMGLRWSDASRPETPGRAQMLTGILLLVAVLAQIFSHTAWRWYPRPYYFDTATAWLAVLVGLGLAVLEPGAVFRRLVALAYPALDPGAAACRRTGLVVWMLIVTLPALEGARRVAVGDEGHQKEMLDAARWIERNVPEGERVGAFNAGILACFSGRPVVNLDGAVSPAAYRALRARDLASFVREQNVSYLVDFDPHMRAMYADFLGDLKLTKVADIDRPQYSWSHSSMAAFRVQ